MEADDLLCLRNARPRKDRKVAWPSSCSRNAHDQNVLVRRAQSRIDQATLENNRELGGHAQFETHPGRYPTREFEQVSDPRVDLSRSHSLGSREGPHGTP
jgi:hypothetical protein